MHVRFSGKCDFFLFAMSPPVKWASKRPFAEALHVLRLNCSLRCRKKRKNVCLQHSQSKGQQELHTQANNN